VLTRCIEFIPARDVEPWATVPPAPAVFLLRGDDPQSEPYVSKTANLRRRLQRLLGASAEHSKKLNLRDSNTGRRPITWSPANPVRKVESELLQITQP